MLNNVSKFWFPFAIITLLVVGFMSNDLFLPSLPIVSAYFKVSSNWIQNTISIWFLGSTLLQIVLGPLSDRYGQKIILLMSVLLLAFASLICAQTSNIFCFFIGRFLQGVSVSGIMMGGFAYIHEIYEKEGKATAMLGYVGMATAVSPLLGPLLGGYISAYINWQANFYLVSIVCVIQLFLLFKYAPVINIEKKSINSFSRAVNNYKLLLSNVIFTSSVGCYGLLFFAGGAFLAAAPFIYTDMFQIEIQHIGFGMVPMFICYMLAAGMAGKLEKIFPASKIISISLSLLCISVLIFMAFSSYLNNFFVSVIFFVAIYYLGLGLIGPPLNHISLSQATSDNKGTASAVLTSTMMFGSTMGSFILSLFYNKTLYSVELVIGVPIFCAMVFYWICSKHYLKIPTLVQDKN